MSRVRELVDSIPLVTRALLLVNVGIYVGMFLMSTGLNQYAISAFNVIYNHQYYRIVSSAFVHANAMHIFMNMSTLLQLGPYLEQSFGSFNFFLITFWTVLFEGLFYVGLSWSWAYVHNDRRDLFESGVGYSGVLFCYAVIESFHTLEATRSVFGLFTIPAKIYPFTLLVIIQVMMPGISFLGHLSGVLVGLCIVYGLLSPLLPSSEKLGYWETRSCGRCVPLVQLPGYVATSSRSLVITNSSSASSSSSSSSPLGMLGAAWSSFSYCLLMIWNVVATVLHIFGLLDIVTSAGKWIASVPSRVYSSVTSFSYQPVPTSESGGDVSNGPNSV